MATVPPTVVTGEEMMHISRNITDCAMFDGQVKLCMTIEIVKRCVATVSILGCLAVIVVIWLFRKYLIFIQRLILYLSISELFEAVSFLVGYHYDSGPLCTFQAWIVSFFAWTVLIWNSCVTFNLYMTAIRNVKTEKVEWAYHLISWGVSFIIACLPLIGNHYGPAGIWCWIVEDWGWRFGTYYLPMVISLIVMLSAYVYISVMVSRQSKTWEGLYEPDIERKKQLLREDLKPLKWYPFAYLAIMVFPTINRIQNATGSDPVFALMLIHVISNAIYGTTLAIVFFVNKEIRSQLTLSQMKDAFRRKFIRSQAASIIQEYPTGDHGSMSAREEGNAVIALDS